MKRGAGFTLIELVITVAILGVLALMAVPLLDMTIKRHKESDLRLALRQIRGALDEYRQAVRDKRIEAAADASGYPKTLEVLAEGVRDLSSPEGKKIYFLRRLPRDPFNPDATLSASGTWNKRAYASPPDDPREGEDVFDVRSASPLIGLNGVPYQEW
jgi:general secretion pathway protein G